MSEVVFTEGFFEGNVKRIFDIVFSLSVLFFIWPVLLISAIVIRATMGSPVFYNRERPGYLEQLFTIYKFRTMTDACDQNGNLLLDDLRIAKIGAFIRKYSIDELFQFVNVLKGDMSVVGPRPLLIQYLPLYSERQRLRHAVKPGISGWAQINGRNSLSWSAKFELDVWYAEHH